MNAESGNTNEHVYGYYRDTSQNSFVSRRYNQVLILRFKDQSLSQSALQHKFLKI